MIHGIDLNKLSLAALFELNKLIVKEIRHKQTEDARTKAIRFRVGEAVEFNAKGHYRQAIIRKFNQKTITVVETDVHGRETLWKVPSSMLNSIDPSRIEITAESLIDDMVSSDSGQEMITKPTLTDVPKTRNADVW